MTKRFDVIFDNGGGTTLQVGKRGYVHAYDDPAQAAQDVKVLLDTGTTADWEGNQPECRMNYDLDMERNGGYRWHDQDRVKSIIKSGKLSTIWGRNMQAFYAALGVEVPAD